MSDSFHKLPLGTQRFQGYVWDPANASPDYLSAPSSNCFVTETGKAESRPGYTHEFSIGSEGNAATAFYLKTYDVAFFALGTKVYYRDFTANATYDTGITLTAGTTTRFAEFNGDVYLTNTTDGIKRIMVCRVNDAAATLGDGSITLDVDGAARLSVFGDTSGNIRIQGVNEAYNAVDVATGVLTVPANLTASYPDNAIAVFVDAYSSLEKPSKIEFWKSRMHIMGFVSAANADQPNNTVMAGQFVSGAATAGGNATDIQNIVDFTYGTGGSTKITVGSGGKTANILGDGETLYFFNDDRTFAAEASDVTSSGAGIGGTVPLEKDRNHGCVNEDCAISMGNGEIGWVTNDRRIMRRRISSVGGAAAPYSDESFDTDIAGHLKDMDSDQTGALAFHYRGQRKSVFQLKCAGQWYWFVFDHKITRTVGSTVIQGAWQPPQQIAPVRSLFERNGVLWGTDASTDKVYSIFTAFTDDLTPIQVTVATGEFNVGKAMMTVAELHGEVNQTSDINIRCYVWNNSSGKRSGSVKHVLGSGYSYTDDDSVSALSVGEAGSVAATTQTAKWDREFGIFPSEATRVQLVAENFQDGGYMSITSFQLSGTQYPGIFPRSA